MTEKSTEQINQPLLKSQPKPLELPISTVSFFALFKYADGKDKLQLFLGTIAALAAGCAFPFFMIFFGDILTVFLPGNRDKAVQNAFDVTIKFIIIGAATWFLSFVGLYCWNQSGSNQSLRFKKLYYQTLLSQQVAWYDSNDCNKLATQVASNISQIEGAIGQKCFMFISTVTTSLFGFVYAYAKCWQLSLVLTGALPFMMIAGVLMMKSLANAALISKTSYEYAAARAEQAFGGIKTIKSLVGEIYEEKIFVDALDKGKKQNAKTILGGAISLAFVIFIFLGLYALGFWWAKRLIIVDGYQGGVVLGTFFCFIIGGSSVGQIAPIAKNFAEGKIAVSRLYELIERKKSLNENVKDGKKIKKIKSIQFNNVKFIYRKVALQPALPQIKPQSASQQQPAANSSSEQNKQQNIVLKNINLTISKQKVTALVGESGSGKSTISQLLLRYYDPVQGQISINGTPLTEVEIEHFRRTIGYVGQEPVLFAMSIQDNIKMANPTLSEVEVVQILKKANAWEFVEKLEKGMKTYVGANGTQLSGGQKQRIAIARAIAKNPQILILDEATSALDRKNQRQIQQTLKNLTAQKITTLVIAHRLSTIKDADNIIVLRKGQIIEQGIHDDLTSKQGYYYTLVKTQLQAHAQQIESSEQKVIGIDTQEKELYKQQLNKQEVPKQKLDAVFKKLFKFGSSHNGYLFVGVFFALVNGGVWPFFNVAFSNILAMMAEAAKHQDEINNYCLLFLAVAVAGGLCTFSYKFPLDMYSQKIVYDIRKSLFHKFLRLPVSYYDKKENTPGAISTKMASDAYQLNNMISGVLAVMCMNFSTVAISLFFAFYHSWMLTLIVLAISPLIMVAGAINMKILKGITSKTQESQKFLGSLISDTVVNIRTVKSFGNNGIFIRKYEEKLDTIANLNNEKALKSSFFQGMSRGMIMVVQGITFLIAGYLYQNHHIQDGNSIYIPIFSIIFAAMGVGQNSAFMPDMAKAKVAGASIFDTFQSRDQSTIIELNGGGRDRCTPDHFKNCKIEFKDVTFKYPERDTRVLQDFSYTIEPNTKIAFVGPSGSGKSTITQLIERFYPLESGSIEINGNNIENFELYSYRQQIGYVSQQPTLFIGTIRDNIQYSQTYPQNVMDEYATISHAKGFIGNLEEKYDKTVGNKGTQVSGGQKQRIALTRCLIRQPGFYMFDESTSALDTDTQRVVFTNLKPILKSKTSISIAHRLATIEDSDRIVVMRQGKIIEEGGYNELMDKKEHFYRLAKGQ